MISISDWSVYGWQEAIRGARNSWHSHERCDSEFDTHGNLLSLGNNDYSLLKMLSEASGSHAKYRRMIAVYCDITAPLYWWKEFDTYKVGTVANSESTMHTLLDKPLDISRFSVDQLFIKPWEDKNQTKSSMDTMAVVINQMNFWRDLYLNEPDPKVKKDIWYQIIQLLPSSFNQGRTVMLNYEVLANIYKDRKNHKLEEWQEFCKWIKFFIPYSYLITGEETHGI